ncbi:SLC13 family permease [Minwuia thermotolerans]|uniref:SLC13 family permease n=1 Tax=Minwuia thermotolerans TaxID=2056226 RepID=A0A2M9G4U8_9PROT|nr:SLC13 family permease [Minwuia thermotolerans]PJK30741.1 SLC13 family permease [Minwuia thermotolerans]
MTTDQVLLFSLFAVILGMLLWGRLRHDLVAAGGLLLGVTLGLVPQDEAFSGFSNPAVIIVALVLIASRAFENSGVLGMLARLALRENRSAGAHITIFGGVAAALSAVINNVAALAMLMPLDVQAARKAGRPPGQTLMPLSFATILGGMVTLIGTPPNIIASAVREQQLGEPYSMFDFAPVGAAVAVAGVLFVALVGWRLVPRREDRPGEIDPASFVAELLVPEDSRLDGRVGVELDEEAEEADVRLVGLIRDGETHRGAVRALRIRAGDRLVVEGSTDAIAAFIKLSDLQKAEIDDSEKNRGAADETAGPDARKNGEDSETEEEKEDKPVARGPEIIETVVRADSRLVGQTATSISMRQRYGITLLGIARAGTVTREGISRRTIEAGDELLITGRQAGLSLTLDQLGLVAVNRISVAGFKPFNAALAVGLFAGAIAVATAGLLSFTVAIAIAVAGYAAFGLVPAREFYSRIEWPVVVMLACLLPLGAAFENVGGTALIANSIAGWTEGHSAVVALVAIMVVTLTLSDVLNNVATMVITGPIAIDLALRLEVNPDTFLMGVAISASCAFLTPIGHKNNTLIMGPGGFRFSDYWRMGLPLEIVVLAVSVPMLLIVWPL